MPKFGVVSSRRRQGSNNGWRRPPKTPSQDRTRTPSRGSAAGSCYGITVPSVGAIMRNERHDLSEGPPKDLDPADGDACIRGDKERSLAGRLWADNYDAEHDAEFREYIESGALELASQLLYNTPASSYVRQNRRGEVAASRSHDSYIRLMMGWCAQGVHKVNSWCTPFSIASRSIQHLGHKSSIRSSP